MDQVYAEFFALCIYWVLNALIVQGILFLSSSRVYSKS